MEGRRNAVALTGTTPAATRRASTGRRSTRTATSRSATTRASSTSSERGCRPLPREARADHRAWWPRASASPAPEAAGSAERDGPHDGGLRQPRPELPGRCRRLRSTGRDVRRIRRSQTPAPAMASRSRRLADRTGRNRWSRQLRCRPLYEGRRHARRRGHGLQARRRPGRASPSRWFGDHGVLGGSQSTPLLLGALAVLVVVLLFTLL